MNDYKWYTYWINRINGWRGNGAEHSHFQVNCQLSVGDPHGRIEQSIASQQGMQSGLSNGCLIE